MVTWPGMLYGGQVGEGKTAEEDPLRFGKYSNEGHCVCSSLNPQYLAHPRDSVIYSWKEHVLR